MRWTGWILRVAAWLLLAGAALRVLVDIRYASVAGRLYQAHLRLEAPGAYAALGLDRFYDAQRYVFAPGYLPGDGPPAWLEVRDRNDAAPWERIRCIRIDRDGKVLLPALTNEMPGGISLSLTLPEDLMLPGRGTPITVAVTAVGSHSPDWVFAVWRHRHDRWVNLLTFKGPACFDFYCCDDHVALGRPERARLTWDAASEVMGVAPESAATITVLPRLPDQVWKER